MLVQSGAVLGKLARLKSPPFYHNPLVVACSRDEQGQIVRDICRVDMRLLRALVEGWTNNPYSGT